MRIPRWLHRWLCNRLFPRLTTKPDFLIGPPGEPYLRRWWIIPRNRWFNIYLHEMLHDDEDRALHDHPFPNCSIVLRRGYVEITPERCFIRCERDIVFRRATVLHRLKLMRPLSGPPSVSLFITGPRIRVWGFACPRGWIPWTDFVDSRDHGAPGKGCGEA